MNTIFNFHLQKKKEYSNISVQGNLIAWKVVINASDAVNDQKSCKLEE